MKFIKLKTLKIVGIVSMIFSLTACELGLQESFDFQPDVDLTNPYDNITAWDFIQTQDVLNEDGNFQGEQFNYLIAAIQRADMVEEYNGADANRTYLLLTNNAFTGGGDVIQIVTGSSSIPEGETPEETMARADVDKLRHVLSYHIVTTYIDQVPTLEVYNTWYLFQTLVPGDGGLIGFKRDDRYRIEINRAPCPLPSTATSWWERVRLHNYVFDNGIGHTIQDPVRNTPY